MLLIRRRLGVRVFGAWAVLAFCAVDGTVASLWRVASDGSGDHSTVHDAVLAAASGDTISIANGIYPETPWLINESGSPVQAITFVNPQSLTFIGDSRDSVLLGPITPAPDLERGPAGILVGTGVQSLALVNLTIRNVGYGIDMFGSALEVQNCVFSTCDTGVSSFAPGSTEIHEALFMNCDSAGILIFAGLGAAGPLIEGCRFEYNRKAIGCQVQGGIVRDSVFLGGVVGAQASNLGSLSIVRCHFSEQSNVSVSGVSESGLELIDCVFGPVNGAIFATGPLNGTGNLIEGGTYATMVLGRHTIADFRGNHILNGGMWSVVASGLDTPAPVIDLANNYWGTTDPEQIRAWIQDAENDPATNVRVEFQPFLSTPVQTQDKSVGSLKALFRQ